MSYKAQLLKMKIFISHKNKDKKKSNLLYKLMLNVEIHLEQQQITKM